MTHRLIRRWLPAAACAAAIVAPAALTAQAPPRGSAELLAQLSAKATPRLSGKPDLNGTWDHLGGIEFIRPTKLPDGSVCIRGCAPPAGAPRPVPAPAAAPRPAAAPPAPLFPKYKPEFLAKVKDLSARQVETDSGLRCMAPGLPRLGPPGKIIQTAKEVVFLYDDVNGAFFRIIPVDGRKTYRKDMPASYLGDSIGRFEGDTLVVETTNFNDDTWLTDNGAFHTTDLKVVERLRRVGDTIEYTATSHDPAVLVEPWNSKPYTMWITSQELEEPARCEDRDLDHVVDGTHHDNPR
ncbi:MAG TPA: hypothetical protein VFD69_20105 [Vicinamibacterales bacterium]|nr:hypothetical protein [Vicinamibacterales bacterium]